MEYKEEADRIRYKEWITPGYKLAVYLGETFGELYEVTEDLGETNNI